MNRMKKLAVACALVMGTGIASAVTPTISNSSTAANTLTINGTSLSGGTATITVGNSAPLSVTGQSATQLVATLPAGLASGDYTLYVQIGSSRTNSTSSIVTLGAVGPTGAQGPVGATGATGTTGAAGAQGAQGVAGPAGPQGLKGDTGAAGAAGPQGLKGDVGATGAQGAKGDTGAQGVQGLQGPTGPQGPAGPAGGPTGPQGPQGPMGPAGGPALQLVDANGVVVGSTYSASYGTGLVIARINSERIIVPFGWATPGMPGPSLAVGTTGYLAFTSTDCTGPAYIVNGWSNLPGASKPSALYPSGGGGFVIYIPSTTTTQTFNSGSVLYGGPPYGGNSTLPTCAVSQNTNVQGVPADSGPISLNWTAPFSVQ